MTRAGGQLSRFPSFVIGVWSLPPRPYHNTALLLSALLPVVFVVRVLPFLSQCAMSAKPESQARALRRVELSKRICNNRSARMPACSRCVKSGSECVVAPNLHSSCARCIKSGHDSSCNVFMSFKECKLAFRVGEMLSDRGFFFLVDTLTARIEKARLRRRELKRQLREVDKEKDELEKKRREMVDREVESCREWDLSEGRQDVPPGFVPDGSVMWDASGFDFSAALGMDWAMQPSVDIGEANPGNAPNL